jgi:hypothetical protein
MLEIGDPSSLAKPEGESSSPRGSTLVDDVKRLVRSFWLLLLILPVMAMLAFVLTLFLR